MTQPGDDPVMTVAEGFRLFGRSEARGRSAAYERLAESVADDAAITGFVASLPPDKHQPNLLFAAARYLLGAPPDIAALRDLVGRSTTELTRVMLARRVQTNEPARCAVLLPVLARLPQPLALIDVGASAGLTLLFDRYSYDYAGHRIGGRDPDAPTLRCEPRGPVPLPREVPAIAWRAGLDLNPLDVTDDDAARWLTCLVWPGESDRGQRLAGAIAAARRDPPTVYRGDLLTGLPALAARAPRDATLVIYHSSVLYQVPPPQRERFAATVRDLGASWVYSEGPGIVPGTGLPGTGLSGMGLPGTGLTGTALSGGDGQTCVVARDGRPVATADSHGAWLRWLT
jgi:hypothetical protein